MATGGLHSSSKSSATSDGSSSSSNTSKKCELTITSVNQTQKLLRLLRRLPLPDPHKDESVTSWCDVFSLESLRLTLPQIIEDCQLREKSVFEEFPFSSHLLSAVGTSVKHPSHLLSAVGTSVKHPSHLLSAVGTSVKHPSHLLSAVGTSVKHPSHLLSAVGTSVKHPSHLLSVVGTSVKHPSHLLSVVGTSVKHPKPSPSQPKAHIDLKALSLKKKYLKLLIKFYENRIHWLSIDSRRWFGVIRGRRVVVLAEDSSELGVMDAGTALERYKERLKQLMDEQLRQKETVYLVKFGSRASPSKPHPLSFLTKQTKCKALAAQWVDLLQGEGSCNLLDALRVGLSLSSSVDTICVVLQTQPDQDVSRVRDYLVDTLTGESSPTLHVISLTSPTPSLRASLRELAEELHAHYHSVEECEGVEGETSYVVEDSDISVIRSEISRTRSTLTALDQLKHGRLDDPIIEILRELSLTTNWAEDDNFPIMPRPSENHALVCDSREWLRTHGTDSKGLSLYQFLSPNTYPQLTEHVQLIDRMAVSHVYDVMPVFTWHDGSTVYLHIDVEAFHHYLHTLTQHITHALTPRLHWLLSGSNVPFGALTQPRVVVAIDSSHSALAHILTLQHHIRMLLEEQIAHLDGFNLVRFGGEVSFLSRGLCQPVREVLLQAWEWVLGMSPSGTCDLLSALRLIFESEDVLKSEDAVGVYLLVTALPDQPVEVLCSYLEQAMAGRAITVNVIYYNMEFSVGGLVIPGREGGRYGSEEETEECLRTIAKTGRGRFHHFRVSGSSEGDDTDLLLGEISHSQSHLLMAEKILNDYREFCKRNVPPPPLLVSSDSPEHRHPPPPTHPRQTAASLARLNASLKKVSSLPSISSAKPRAKRGGHRLLKAQSYYTGLGNKKVVSWDFPSDKSQCFREKGKPLIPLKEGCVSSKEWLSRYSLEKLDLAFNKLLPSKNSSRSRAGSVVGGVSHKHINRKGELVELSVSHTGLRGYTSKLSSVLSRYQARMDWLHRDCHTCVGVVTESDVVFLLDVSVSMAAHIDSIKRGLCATLRDHPPSLKRFNIVAFSSQVSKWHEQLTPVSKETTAKATEWIQTLKAEGGSCLLDAIKVVLESDTEGIYLVTDGTANHTQEFLLSQLPVLRRAYGERWRVNTVTFQSAHKEAHSFLKQLAHSTGGRFHVSMTSTNTDSSSHTGDDISLLDKEIKKVHSYLKLTRL